MALNILLVAHSRARVVIFGCFFTWSGCDGYQEEEVKLIGLSRKLPEARAGCGELGLIATL